MKHCIIIGISDSHQQWFAPEVESIIRSSHFFSGGKRHHEIMRNLLPSVYEWIDITVPLSAVFENYRNHESVVIFASGDPLFYGFGNTVIRECPDCEIEIYPSFNSLQLLAHHLKTPYHDMRCVSLTGRPWDKFDEALIRNEQMIGCLTDHNKTPEAIWLRMQDYGYYNYRMFVGEKLGNKEEERVSEFKEGTTYANPNCILLQQTHRRIIPFGIPDNQFELLNGREKMITKMPIRLATLAELGLGDKKTFWDIGFCTGSISIEAKLRFPHLNVTAFEIREEGRLLMSKNARKFGTPGINAIIGDFLEANLSALPQPDAVFIGGHGGRLAEMVSRIRQRLAEGGCIVFNSVSESSRQIFISAAESNGMRWKICHQIQTNDNNPITILKAE